MAELMTVGVSDLREALGGRSIVFVGMMGSGKTAVGRLVATALDIPFYDSDQEIVAAANMEIPEIFEKHGEPYFRAGEERVIQRLLSEGPTVLSLGGGAFMSEATRQAIAEAGISVWLKADIELLMSRVLRRPGTRPLLNTPDPKATLRQLQEKREPVYALADLHVESSRISKTHTRDAVLAALEEKLLGQQKS
ncbi:MAG: shikimate kinase [Phyllobacteriaceae bacterium]|nr:shikimate kinase [Phyllobacteriaceae bacterium]